MNDDTIHQETRRVVLNGIDDGFSFECVEFDVTIVRHPNRVIGV